MGPSSRALVTALLLLAGGGAGQPPDPAAPSPPLSPELAEELRVTSVDLWLALERDGVGAWLRGDREGSPLSPSEVQLLVDGRPVEAVSIASAASVSDAPRIVLYFDAELADRTALRWGAARLAERAESLTALGEVEVVVADPDPRVAVPATRDSGRLAEALGGLALFAGDAAAIPLLRDEFLSLAAEGSGAAEAELASAFAHEEIALVLERQDSLLQWLADRTVPTRGGRVLLYVSQGFDRRPEDFYAASGSGVGRLEGETREWARTVAAYGWTCLPLVYEDRRALLRRGFRIGRWRFIGPGGGRREGGPSSAPLALFGARYEAERDAEKAEALVALGDGELSRGADSAAVDAYLRAIHHFYGDPRTTERQAYVWRQLARALRGAGEIDRSRHALANAVELDPSIQPAADEGIAAAGLRDVEGVEELAAESGGRVLRDGESLSAALDALSRRQRLTFELAGAPTGELLPVVLSRRGRDGLLESVRWVRFGAPPRVAAARLRLFLRGHQVDEPDDEVELEVRLGRALGEDAVVATLSLPDLDHPVTRVLIGAVAEDSPERVVPLVRAGGSEVRQPFWRGSLGATDDVVAVAVYAEDVASGAWSTLVASVEAE